MLLSVSSPSKSRTLVPCWSSLAKLSSAPVTRKPLAGASRLRRDEAAGAGRDVGAAALEAIAAADAPCGCAAEATTFEIAGSNWHD
eukprot:6214707-Pleurochrysis_carterae.AAC.7